MSTHYRCFPGEIKRKYQSFFVGKKVTYLLSIAIDVFILFCFVIFFSTKNDDVFLISSKTYLL